MRAGCFLQRTPGICGRLPASVVPSEMGVGCPIKDSHPTGRAPECLPCASPKAGVIWKHRPPALRVCQEGLQALQAAPAEEGERAGAFQELQV